MLTIFNISSLWKREDALSTKPHIQGQCGMLWSSRSAHCSTVQGSNAHSMNEVCNMEDYLHNRACVWWLLPVVCVWSC